MARFKILSLLFFLAIIKTNSAKAQKGYWYTSAKVPMLDFISSSLSGNSEPVNDDKFNGVGIDLGRGFPVSEFIYIETGIEYLTANTWNKKSYQDKKNAPSSPYTRNNLYNSAFAFQLKPVFSTMSEDDKVGFNAGIVINYQKLITKSNLQQFSPSQSLYTSESQNSASSSFGLNVQPSAGIRWRLSEHYAIAFDLSYKNINWNRSIAQLNNIHAEYSPNLRTRDIFFCGRIIID